MVLVTGRVAHGPAAGAVSRGNSDGSEIDEGCTDVIADMGWKVR